MLGQSGVQAAKVACQPVGGLFSPWTSDSLDIPSKIAEQKSPACVSELRFGTGGTDGGLGPWEWECDGALVLGPPRCRQ